MHNPPFSDCQSPPPDGSPYQMTPSDMTLAYETAMWYNMAGQTDPVVCNTTGDSINPFTPYCATCYSRNDFETNLAYCNSANPNIATQCQCTVFFGGLNTQYGTQQGIIY